jgi:predicted NAD-dependent protein-ADP-ribosyltransferase YbiA (DUF1768 family)
MHARQTKSLGGAHRTVRVQASALDTVWGSGLDLDDPFLPRPAEWPGRNLVGFSLMKVREDLASNQSRAVFAVVFEQDPG